MLAFYPFGHGWLDLLVTSVTIRSSLEATKPKDIRGATILFLFKF